MKWILYVIGDVNEEEVKSYANELLHFENRTSKKLVSQWK